MRNAVVHQKVRELASCAGPHCLSIFMPIVQGEHVGPENLNRLKNLLGSAEQGLVDRGMRPVVAREMIAAIEKATTQPGFWNDGSCGLAIFACPDRRDLLRLPERVEESWAVGWHFRVTPLLEFETDCSFVVLALTRTSCRVFRGSRWTITPLDVPGLPASEKDTPPAADHQHTTPVFAGQGAASGRAKAEFLAYCRQVDAALCEFLGPSTEPLVLAAVSPIEVLYRQVNRYGRLHAATIDGSLGLWNTRELHGRAWEIVLPGFVAHQQQALAKCAELAAGGRARGGLDEIVNAAHAGRIETLLVSPTPTHWGTFDPSTGQCHLTQPHAPSAEDLLNLAAVETLRHGGDAYAVDLLQAGIQDPAAAVYKLTQVADPPLSEKPPRSNGHGAD